MLSYQETGVLIECLIHTAIFLIIIYFVKDKAKLSSKKFLWSILLFGFIYYFVAGFTMRLIIGNNYTLLLHTAPLFLFLIYFVIPFFIIKSVIFALRKK